MNDPGVAYTEKIQKTLPGVFDAGVYEHSFDPHVIQNLNQQQRQSNRCWSLDPMVTHVDMCQNKG